MHKFSPACVCVLCYNVLLLMVESFMEFQVSCMSCVFFSDYYDWRVIK